nr:hypothetical protein [Tanacetum cinerariifolium]
MRIDPEKTQKEPTYQVVLDALALTNCYLAFLITVDVPVIYMQQFWVTINKHGSSYQFKIDKKRFFVDMEVFREILQICPRIPDQEFDEPPFKEEILSFIKELSHTGKIKNINAMVVDYMHQPWRTFDAIINKCLNGKIAGSDKIHLSRAQILWGMYYKKNIDFVALLWEDFAFQIDNRDAKKQDKIILGILRCVSKDEDTQVYGALIPAALKRSKQEMNIHQAGGSSEGADFELEVLDEPKGKLIDTSEGTGLKLGVPDVSKEETEDDFVHTPPNYVPTDDEMNDESNDVTKEEYERINEELYGDVNVNLTDAEPAEKEKDDDEMTVAGHVIVNQEGSCNQVKDDAQETQKTEGLILSSSILSDYAVKFLNFDNIPLVDIKVVSMLDINVQHEVPHTSSLLTIHVFVIPEQNVINQYKTVTTTPTPTITLIISSLYLVLQQIAPIPTPIAAEAITSTTDVPDSETLCAL